MAGKDDSLLPLKYLQKCVNICLTNDLETYLTLFDKCILGLEGRLLMSPPATLSVAHLDKFPERPDLPTKVFGSIEKICALITC